MREDAFNKIPQEPASIETPRPISGFSRVVGASPKRERAVLEEMQNRFQNQEPWPWEAEKTEVQKKIIEGILKYLPDFIVRHGGTYIPVTVDHIHLMDMKKAPKEFRKSFAHHSGVMMPTHQEVLIFKFTEDPMLFAHIVMHELIHFQSFGSLNSSDENEDLAKALDPAPVRHQGLKILNDEFSYFHQIDEAITEEMATEFNHLVTPKLPELAEEVRLRTEFAQKNSLTTEQQADLIGVQHPKILKARFGLRGAHAAYATERANTRVMFDEIVAELKKAGEPEKSIDEVREIFIKAKLTGRTLELARLLELTYGKGGFRNVAENSGLSFKDFEEKGL
jgi:hypothetical protein